MAEPTLFQNGYVAFTTSTGGSTYTEVVDVKSIQLPISMAELGNGVMGDVGEVFYPGLIQAPLTVRCRQSFAATSADAILTTRMLARTFFKVKVRAVDSAVATTNPTWILSKVGCFAGGGISGSHGELLENEYQLRMGSGCTVTRSTST